MPWFLIALISPFLSSVIHHADKYLLSKFKRQHSIGSIILFSSLFPILLLPFFILYGVRVETISFENISLLIVTGIFSALSLLFYFYALEDEEASLIVPMFQLVPVFGYFLGIVVLGESIAGAKLLAALVVLLGATILSFEFEEEMGLHFKLKPTLFMVAASLFLSLNDVIFKSTTIKDGSYVISIFWNLVGYAVFGILMFLLVHHYRRSFLMSLRENGRKFLAINLGNEVLQTGAVVSFSYAILLAPLALVLLVEAYQPAFVLIIGIVLTKFFPRISTERITGKYLLHKILAIAIIVIGSIFVYY